MKKMYALIWSVSETTPIFEDGQETSGVCAVSTDKAKLEEKESFYEQKLRDEMWCFNSETIDEDEQPFLDLYIREVDVV